MNAVAIKAFRKSIIIEKNISIGAAATAAAVVVVVIAFVPSKFFCNDYSLNENRPEVC